MRTWHKWLGQWLIFNILYFVLAMFSLESRDPWSLSSALWLPSGLVLGILCTYPARYWPLCAISAGLLHLSVSLLYGRALDVALTFAIVDLAVLFPLAMMWHSIYHYLPSISYLTQTLLLLLGVYLGSITGGLISILMLTLLEYPVVLSHFFTWSLSNATGCLASAPFFIARHFFKETYRPVSWRQSVVFVVVAAMFLFLPTLIHHDLLNQLLLYLVLGVSLLFAMRWPLYMSAIYFFCLTLLVSAASLSGYGPFANAGVHSIQGAQLYLLAVISLGLITAAQVKESEGSADELRKIQQLLCDMLEKQQPVFFQLSSDTGKFNWSGNPSVFGISPQTLPSLLLLQARIHPQDRPVFVEYINKTHASEDSPSECFFRILLSDQRYHKVCCKIAESHSLTEVVGVLMLSH